MEAMRRAIAEASATTASMLEKARRQDTGLKLEVYKTSDALFHYIHDNWAF